MATVTISENKVTSFAVKLKTEAKTGLAADRDCFRQNIPIATPIADEVDRL
jgi:hypothetical protein